jgi:hypothetical protein
VVNRPERILARWSRRKQETAREGKSLSRPPQRDGAKTEPAGTHAVSPAETSEAASEEFDAASLPPIESITASTDIHSFLKAGVPRELTRSALRRAWTVDPAIRDFIGIAENQWDFNDVAGIPGFGPLRATDSVACLAVHTVHSADDVLGLIVEVLSSSPQTPTS